MRAYRVRGTTDDMTTCEQCGRDELKGTVILECLDAEGNTGELIYVGSGCAATLSKRTQREIKDDARRAGDATAQAAQRGREARTAAETAGFLAWVRETYGVTADTVSGLWDHEKALGMTPFQARKAWREAA